ncbi:MAG TPA: hypothetical protein VGC67_14095 [Cellulomonas sp.]
MPESPLPPTDPSPTSAVPAPDDDAARLREQVAELTARVDELDAEAATWRAQALSSWTETVARTRQGVDLDSGFVSDEVEAMKATLSWRVTRPLRGVRRLITRVKQAL